MSQRLQKKCLLCGRSKEDIGEHILPVIQNAHIVPNRLSGVEYRYGGVKNAFTKGEWKKFLRRFREDLSIEKGISAKQARSIIGNKTIVMCGECHEEVLSEPIYLPRVLESLKPYFKGKNRIEKIILLSEVIKRGVESLENDGKNDS